jgi:hypothetical protein
VIAYITQFAQREAMQPRLQAWDTTPDAFVQTMLVKSERNFMYLWHVLPAIERGEFRHGTLAELPQGLRNYYEHHWRQIRAIDETSWVKYRQPVIYYLAAASAPVTVYQIKSWSKIPSSQVLLAIRDWREFLKIQTVGNETRYHIYHSFFQEFLKDKDEVKTLD